MHNVQIAIQLSFLHFEYCVDKGSSLTHFFYLIVEIKFNNFTREFFILISNNLFLKHAPFYNSNNIFIIDNLNLEGLTDFMSHPFVQVKSEFIDYYRFDNWLSRFEM